MASKDYSGFKKAELIGIAKRKRASVTASMNKDEIIKAIKKVDKAKASAKSKPASKSKAKAKAVIKAKVSAKSEPVSKPKAKAKAVIKAKVSAKSKLASKSKAKSKPVIKAKVSAKSKPASKPKAKAKLLIKAKVKVNVKAKSKAAPSAAGKNKIASVAKSTGKPTRKVSRVTMTKKPASKPVGKSKGQNDWSMRMAARKFFTADERADFPTEEIDTHLPDRYGENKLVALPKDPKNLFLYWEVEEAKAEEARQSLGKNWDQIKWTLRVFDVTSLQGVEEAYHNFFDVTIELGVGKHYLEVEGDGREYIVELGLKDNNKRFSSICFSNRVQTPKTGISRSGEEISDEKAGQLYALSGGHHPGSLFSEEMASMGVSSFGASEQSPEIHVKRDYFLWVNCELTVYGGATPGSKLTLQGEEINLRPDGTFSAKFHLPDGVQDIQISGTSSDGVDNKEISLSVSRSSRIVR